MNDTLALVLAGGKGSRLEPLTRDRAKPAVPFGGAYRIIDFTLSNCLNSGLRRMLVLTQYKAMSLERHINIGWRRFFCRDLGEFIDVLPPQQRLGADVWYQGTADAVYQNIYAIEMEQAEYIVILAGDHIYKMNYAKMIDYHKEVGADLTVGALRIPRNQSKHFGVMQIDEDQRIRGFIEKSADAPTIPGDSQHCLGSMGIYVFNARFLFEQLLEDANNRDSSHDFGHNVIPSIIDDYRVFAYPFLTPEGGDAYWRDVGTLDAYYEANMDLVGVTPELNMYEEDWPIRTVQQILPPPKFVFGSHGDSDRVGTALDSVVCQGTIISGGRVERSVLGPKVRVNSFAHVQDSILLEGVTVGRHAKIHRAIIDKNVNIPSGFEIGCNLDEDADRGFFISEGGVVAIAKSDCVDRRSDEGRVVRV